MKCQSVECEPIDFWGQIRAFDYQHSKAKPFFFLLPPITHNFNLRKLVLTWIPTSAHLDTQCYKWETARNVYMVAEICQQTSSNIGMSQSIRGPPFGVQGVMYCFLPRFLNSLFSNLWVYCVCIAFIFIFIDKCVQCNVYVEIQLIYLYRYVYI